MVPAFYFFAHNSTKGAALNITDQPEISEREVFILRIWKPLKSKTLLWGQLQHVRSGKFYPVPEIESIIPILNLLVVGIDVRAEPGAKKAEDPEINIVSDEIHNRNRRKSKGGIR
jgi:hypothetical protein